ncbi:MAG: hypothetical protein JWN41_286 [Thermoleophilia bacterium]|nr:hypothetical protein [Thermoleophilia bacterium]
MKKSVRKIIAIGCAGATLGVGASVFAASPASALVYARCNQDLTATQLLLDAKYARHAISKATYDKGTAEVLRHRTEWGC